MKFYCYLMLSAFTLSCSRENSQSFEDSSTTAKVTKVSAEQRELIEMLMAEYFDATLYINTKTSQLPVRENTREATLLISINSDLKYKYKRLLRDIYREQYSRIMNSSVIDMRLFKEEIDGLYQDLTIQFDESYKANCDKNLEELIEQFNDS